MRFQVRNFAFRLRSLQQITLTELFNRFVKYFPEISGKISRLLQNGYLRYYIITILLTAIGLMGGVLIGEDAAFAVCGARGGGAGAPARKRRRPAALTAGLHGGAKRMR
jgi:hypothetical protein